MNRTILVLCVALCVFGGCGPGVVHRKEAAETKRRSSKLVKVTRVLSGDTIELEDGRIIKYLGIRAPKGKDPFAEKAKEANSWLLRRGGYKVLLDISSKKDKNGHPMASVYAPYRFVYCFVNRELVQHGFAMVDETHLDEKRAIEFAEAEQEARKQRRGMWK